MNILVLADESAWSELNVNSSSVTRCSNEASFVETPGFDVYINLLPGAAKHDYSKFSKPVIINSVHKTRKQLNANEHVYRINGWSSFIRRDLWEISGEPGEQIESAFALIGRKAVFVPDEPGFIAARVISMIINEAYFAKQTGVSSDKEIDTAMKLGTNYPHGPFEWAAMIGVKNIFALLDVLSQTDKRYSPSSLLKQEATDS